MLSFLDAELAPKQQQHAASLGVNLKGGGGRQETRLMPNRQALVSAGRKDLVDLIVQCGGATRDWGL